MCLLTIQISQSAGRHGNAALLLTEELSTPPQPQRTASTSCWEDQPSTDKNSGNVVTDETSSNVRKHSIFLILLFKV